jgi:NAD(P)-dependent dehydrogenase (short-subunit alcohol dehydrogenase family)
LTTRATDDERHGDAPIPARDVALVQGASRGLGLAFIERLLARGRTHVVATARDPAGSAGLRALAERSGPRLLCVPLDVEDEASIETAAARIGAVHPRIHLLVNCAGLLHDTGLRPEKRLEDADPASLRRLFDINAIGPLLVARHFLPLLRHGDRAVLANLSARVGSIGDNRLGGWYGYRASKAAQNMFTRTLAIELRRRAPALVCVALHPGTVDTDLSAPFRGSGPPGQRFAPEQAAEQLLDVIDSLGPDDSGSFLDWARKPIPW